MDNKKDIFYKTNGLVEPIKNNGLSKDTHEMDVDNVQKDVNGDRKLSVNDFNVLLNKKVEKLVTALYMVTSFLSDSEPLKWKMRDRNITLLSGINNAGNRKLRTAEVDNIFYEHVGTIDEIVSLLEIACMANLISEMNFVILKREYLSLKITIEGGEHKEAKSGKSTLSTDFFSHYEEATSESIKDIDKGQTSQQDMSFNSIDKKQEYKSDAVNSKKSTDLYNRFSASKTPTSQAPLKTNIKKDKTGRRERILRLFKKNKELSIKDISSHILGCSEKTIQRELLALVSDGVLNKKGDRRWSRYSLN